MGVAKKVKINTNTEIDSFTLEKTKKNTINAK